jgi:hypothetical protein
VSIGQGAETERIASVCWDLREWNWPPAPTLGLDVLRCKTFVGVMKEVTMFVTAYNLVRRVMRQAAAQQDVPAERISFVDALRWLAAARPGEALPRLRVLPRRPNRSEPRVLKRRPKPYDLMNPPRSVLHQALYHLEDEA